MDSKNRRLSWFLNRTPLFYCTISVVVLLFFSALAILISTTITTTRTSPPLDRIRCEMAITITKADTRFQEYKNVFKEILGNNIELTASKSPESEVWRKSSAAGTSRRFLGGPGSWPPRCMSKCGRCSPCKPIHVPVPPGTPVTTEYYPEAWRCKCGNRLFMP